MPTAEQVYSVISAIEGGQSENAACAAHGLNRGTFRSAAFRLDAADEYARALAALAQEQVEKVEQVLDEVRAGEIDVATATLEINTRKWFASKFLPKRYGDKLDVSTETKTTVHLVDSTDIAALDNDQREALKEIANALLSQRTAGKAISHWEDVDHEAIEGELSKKA